MEKIITSKNISFVTTASLSIFFSQAVFILTFHWGYCVSAVSNARFSNTTTKFNQPVLYDNQTLNYLLNDEEGKDDSLFHVIQKGISELYNAIQHDSHKRRRDDLIKLEDKLRAMTAELGKELNTKVNTIDTAASARMQSFFEQQTTQRKEDLKTFSDNLAQAQKLHQTQIESQRSEMQQLKANIETVTKGQSSLNAKVSQLQKTLHALDSKLTEVIKKHSEDVNVLQDGQKSISSTVATLEKDQKTTESMVIALHSSVRGLEKAAAEDSVKLRRTVIRESKQEPMQKLIQSLKNKNVGAAMKQWRSIEQIADDLRETLPGDMVHILEEVYGRGSGSGTGNMQPAYDFIHKAVNNGDNRLKEAAYRYLLLEMDTSKYFNDPKKLVEVFSLAQHMKSDLGSMYYGSNNTATSSTVADIVARLPDAIRLITFEKVRLMLPSRGYLRVSSNDRKVTLVPEDSRFYDKDEILWYFEYDKDRADGTYFIKSDKFQKYLVTVHEGFNSYGFSKQSLSLTGNKRESGTRFEVSNVTGDNVLIKSIFYNGYLTWKSNIQTIYGDDDSYFVLLEDKKNGPSPYWQIQSDS